jgi:hypothetical protein
MLVARRTSSTLVVASLSLLSIGAAVASPALAGTPATVTVRVLGPAPAYQALTPLTQVTTTATSVTEDGGSCSGTSAAGALELATKGDWEGVWSSTYEDYEVVAIDKLSYPFMEDAPYWNFWLNNKYEEQGVCHAELEAGDQVLFFPSCFSAEECPTVPGVLGVEAPTTAEVGKPVTVTVRFYPSSGGLSSTVSAVEIQGGGASAETDAEGQAQLSFSGAGAYTLRAAKTVSQETAPVPGETFICVHNGDDGTCGTTPPPGAAPIQPPASEDILQGPPYTGPYALVADVTGILEGRHYARSDAPRVLTGKVVAHASVTSISLRLRRTYRGRCWAYDGTSARFVRARRSQGSFFQIASGGDSFSYLLPASLPPGRYVLDAQATDAAGNHTALARGSSRIVFYVK